MCQVWISWLMLIGAEEIESLWSYRSGEKRKKKLPIFLMQRKTVFSPLWQDLYFILLLNLSSKLQP